jgi:hypothetical protein
MVVVRALSGQGKRRLTDLNAKHTIQRIVEETTDELQFNEEGIIEHWNHG